MSTQGSGRRTTAAVSEEGVGDREKRKEVEGQKRIPLSADEILFVKGKTGVLAITKVGAQREFLVETPEKEVFLFASPEDLIVASGFYASLNTSDSNSNSSENCGNNGESKVKKRAVENALLRGLKCVIFILRELNSPLIVLPREHPATKRLRTVVSVGKRIVLSCEITPGTHPEQHLLCATPEFNGVEILAYKGGVSFRGLSEAVCLEKQHFAALN